MEVMTRKQEEMLRRKKIFRICGSIVSVVLIISAGLFFYLNVISRAVMAPQVNSVIGEGFFDDGDGTWKKAAVGMSVSKGCRFKTGERSTMDILLQDNSVVRITENAEMTLSSLNLSEIKVSLFSGSAFCKIKKMYKGQSLSVKTPTVVAAVRGTEFSTEVSGKGEQGRTDGFCVGGVVSMTSSSGKREVFIEKNHACSAATAGVSDSRQMTFQETDRVEKIIASIDLDRVIIATDRLLFDSGSASITEQMKPELKRIYATLRKIDARIRIVGHTDNVGTREGNVSLSRARAESIKAYFVSRGISADRFDALGMGDAKPLASNATEDGRMKNRRVEFVVTR